MNDVKNQRWPFLKELSKLFNSFNLSLFYGCLEEPSYIVQPEKKWVFKFNSGNNTLSIGGKFVGCEKTQILENFLHEMVHINNHFYKVEDCGSSDYHNKTFLKSALEIGLHVGVSENKGWNLISISSSDWKHPDNFRKPTDESFKNLEKVISELDCNFEIIQEGADEIERILTTSAPSKVYFRKYVCNCSPPHNSIRSGRSPDGINALKVLCLNCNSIFTCENKDGETD